MQSEKFEFLNKIGEKLQSEVKKLPKWTGGLVWKKKCNHYNFNPL